MSAWTRLTAGGLLGEFIRRTRSARWCRKLARRVHGPPVAALPVESSLDRSHQHDGGGPESQLDCWNDDPLGTLVARTSAPRRAPGNAAASACRGGCASARRGRDAPVFCQRRVARGSQAAAVRWAANGQHWRGEWRLKPLAPSGWRARGRICIALDFMRVAGQQLQQPRMDEQLLLADLGLAQ